MSALASRDRTHTLDRVARHDTRRSRTASRPGYPDTGCPLALKRSIRGGLIAPYTNTGYVPLDGTYPYPI